MAKQKLVPAKVIRKHNSLTDGYIPKRPKQVLPDKLLNALYYKFEREGEVFRITLPELKHLLGLEKERNDRRIYEAIQILQSPIMIRNFEYQGQKIEWISAPFVSRVIRWKSSVNEFEFHIDPIVLEAVKQKGGYTPLDIHICNRFRTKFGLKLYEMLHRYSNLPNNRADVNSQKIGVVVKSLQELNNLFGTDYTSPSKLFSPKTLKYPPPLNRALEEIKKITGEVYYCYYDKSSKLFIFSWERTKKEIYPTPECIIPTKSIEPFVKWYMEHFVDNAHHHQSYFTKMVQKIQANKMGYLERYYQLYLLDLGKEPQECFDPRINKFIC